MEVFLKHLIDYSFATTKLLNQITFLQVIIIFIALHLILAIFWVIIGLRTYRQRRLLDENVTLKEVFVQKYPLKFVFSLIQDS